ncbi:MAG TPA: glycosyltransferase family 39 protein [Anaerohalosphaeraceae bacterium]|nr:glycosyltransferase family 39 protein [Anaerohalosphaeraceae bacterium]
MSISSLVRRITRHKWFCPAFLLGLAALLGAYHISRTVVISEDGVLYIKMAQTLPDGYAEICRKFPPGFPVLLYLVHRLAFFFADSHTNLSWIHSSQTAVLLTQLGALFFLWKIGCRLFRPVWAFGGLLILLVLPISKHGCDVLRDWPHLLLLSAAFYALLRNLEKQTLFGWMVSAFLGGVGYLFRPECAQILLYLAVILGILFWKQRTAANAGRLLTAAVLIAAAWLLPVLPYWLYADSVLPSKLLLSYLDHPICIGSILGAAEGNHLFITAPFEFFKTLAENLLYYFLPFWLLGFRSYFLKKKEAGNLSFLLAASFFILNVFLLLMLGFTYGYIAKRHFLPLLGISSLLTVQGMRTLALFAYSKLNGLRSVKLSLFLSLFFPAGILLSLPKLLHPLHYDKTAYRQAAEWLIQHTPADALIVSKDKRIPFYAERQISPSKKTADYIVRISPLSDPPMPQSRYILLEKWKSQKQLLEILAIQKRNPDSDVP